ncbi:MAG: barstar family protein [Lachnospiraceae bacterium]|nr:barstar family protein [Lachnospiraceae bacterium]
MKTIVIDGAYMTDKTVAYAYLVRRLGFPSYFGKNLDALYDQLTDPCEQTQLIIYRKKRMLESLGPYGQRLLDTIQDAVRVNGNLYYAEDES